MRPRWWFGGVAATGVACLVAPFDLVKTHMQTQVVKKGMIETSRKVIKLRGRNVILLLFNCIHWQSILFPIPAGLRGFYDGFAAAAARQMICTSMRFSFYEFGKHLELMRDNLGSKVVLASVAGICSSLIGIPLDVINIRMQNDMKSDDDVKRKYCHWVWMLNSCYSRFSDAFADIRTLWMHSIAFPGRRAGEHCTMEVLLRLWKRP